MSMQVPNPNSDFDAFRLRFLKGIPTTFVRFSDGELEILRDNPLSILNGVVSWRLGTLDGRYPEHDNKSFVPERDAELRSDLCASARYVSKGYFKGVPASSNKAVGDRDYMVQLNGGRIDGLSFSDLFINENYLRFLDEILPVFMAKPNVIFLANFRANLSKLNDDWTHLPLQDNAFPDYDVILPRLLTTLSAAEGRSVILSSASSLSNILGHKLHEIRPDISFIDVGTSLNPFVGLGEATRAYQTQLLPWNSKNISRKLKYQLFGNHRMKW
jgi:hypothetical protein